jgi:hypothetical protein
MMEKLQDHLIGNKSRNSFASEVTVYGLDDWGLIPDKCTYPKGRIIGCSFPGSKPAELIHLNLEQRLIM